MRQIFAIIAIVIASLLASGAAPRWESIDSPGTIFTEISRESETAEVVVRDNVIYVSSPKPVNVKVFTILGQLVSQETLPAGIHRLQMKTKGIYILKIGTLTRRLTI